MALDGVKADIAIWGVAMFALDNSGERFGLEDNERGELFQELLRHHPTAANWKQTRNSLKRFFFIDSWTDEYRTWWNKQIEKYIRKYPGLRDDIKKTWLEPLYTLNVLAISSPL